MFDRFTDRARKAVRFAREAALEGSHEFIGTEHFLVGLVRESNGVAANALKDFGISVDKINNTYKELFPKSPFPSLQGELPFTPMAKKALELSVEEASSLGHNYIGTEHLLLGLTRLDGNSTGSTKLFSKLDVSISAVREEVLDLLGATMDDKSADPAPLPNPIVTLIKRRIERASQVSLIEHKYGPGFAGPRLAVLEELKDLLADVEHLKV